MTLCATMMAAGPLGATTVLVGTVYDDPGYDFSTFGNNANLSTRGANFGGAASVTWYNINMTNDSTGATNGISWSGATASAVASPGVYSYTSIYSGTPGTGAAADSLTNTGIHTAPTINISVVSGGTYSVDLLFANAFGSRTLDVHVENNLYLDNLWLDLTDRRPLVYRFQFLATDSQLTIALTQGAEPGIADTNPYVNAVMVTQIVPEPSSCVLIASGLLGLTFRRRRSSSI